MRGKCEQCGAWRSRLHRCVTCGKRLCGCCSFGSHVGRVCPGTCHREALRSRRQSCKKTPALLPSRSSLGGRAEEPRELVPGALAEGTNERER